MKPQNFVLGAVLAGAVLTGCATSSTNSMLRRADQIERDGREYSEMLIEYANTQSNPADKQELLRYSTSILAETAAVANIVRKQVGWSQ